MRFVLNKVLTLLTCLLTCKKSAEKSFMDSVGSIARKTIKLVQYSIVATEMQKNSPMFFQNHQD